jgi:hypothetical protein
MLVRAALLALAVVLLPTAATTSRAVTEIPDEPGAIVLPDAAILQVVAADLDADGSREVVRMVRGTGDSALAEVWSHGSDGWALAGEPVQVLAPARVGPRVDEVYAGVPLRMLVHRAGSAEQVIVASQPRFDEIDSGPPCCLVLHRLVLDGGSVSRVAVAQAADPVGSIYAIDLDGDGTDELLTSTSLDPLGGISFPVRAGVYRWTGSGFAAPTVVELPVGSGDTPFQIGDSDGRPGAEMAYISTLGPPGLFRVLLGPGDVLEMEAFGEVVLDAVGVPVPDTRGLAVAYPDRVEVHRWPARSAPFFRHGVAAIDDPELVGVAEVDGAPVLLVEEPGAGVLHVLSLPSLTPAPEGMIRPSATVAALDGVPLVPYVGPLRDGRADEADPVVYAGRLFPPPHVEAPVVPMGPRVIGALLGTEPIGVVGDGAWVALLHSPHPVPDVPATGGLFDAPVPRPNAWVSIAPRASVLVNETDDGVLDIDPGGSVRAVAGELATGPDGFTVDVVAPPGSRALRTGVDPSVVSEPIVVPSSGRATVPIVPGDLDGQSRFRATLVVTTPAGHAYTAGWSVEVLTQPPPLAVEVHTPLASSDVVVSGRTSPYAVATVGGVPAAVDDEGRFSARVSAGPWPTEIEVVATDFLGNTTRRVVSGVGVFDYRALPWVAIVAGLLAAAGAALYLRVPRPAERSAPTDDDPMLEEVDPD